MMQRMTIRVLILAAGLAVVAEPQTPANPPRLVSAEEFGVMAWGGSPSDPDQLYAMQQAGLNISGFCRVEDLGQVHGVGLACLVSDPKVTDAQWRSNASDAEVLAKAEELAKAVNGNPAALGVLLTDEPSMDALPGLGRVAKALRKAIPDKWLYVNVFPSHVSAKVMGTPDYEAYVRATFEAIHPPFLSYDNYSLLNGEMQDRFFTNLEIIRRLARDEDTTFWNCILANAHFNYMEPTDATLHLQVYSTLAYGGRGIQYFTYFSPEVGNYRMAAVDPFGNKTATWDMLRRVNLEIHALAPTLTHLRSLGVYHYPSAPEQGQPLSASRLVESVEMTQVPLIKPPGSPRFLVGEFQDLRGGAYIMLVNKDLQHSFRFAIKLRRAEGKLFRVSPYSGKQEPFSGEMNWIAPGAGILLRAD
jgi:hypothetical protein